MMVSVLLRLRPSGLLEEFPTLAAYVAAAKRGLRTNALSPPNGRSMSVLRELGDGVAPWDRRVPGLGDAGRLMRDQHFARAREALVPAAGRCRYRSHAKQAARAFAEAPATAAMHLRRPRN
jgi:hypothetical protein